jgi:hypothetical protein
VCKYENGHERDVDGEGGLDEADGDEERGVEAGGRFGLTRDTSN